MTRVLIDYPQKKAVHCGSGALRDLMEWAKLGWGAPPSEGLVFTLGGALDFAYI
ncbi:MAG: BtrH N-terminal domain-containing protein, partial [Candidatus Nanopelagicales bacterium]